MKPAMISFMGLDGSGKSTSIDYAYEQLKSVATRLKLFELLTLLFSCVELLSSEKDFNEEGQ